MDSNNFNHQDLYKKEIAPHVKAIKEVCAINRLPMYFTCAVENNENETIYKSDMVLSGTDRDLIENRIGNAVLCAMGFEGSLPAEVRGAIDILLEYIRQTNPENAVILSEPLTNDKIELIRKYAHKKTKIRAEEDAVIIVKGESTSD